MADAKPSWSDEAVRSLRVASTLITSFRAIAASNPQSLAELELAIGHSQQIYPEIWRHLDAAWRTLGVNGREVAGYNELRRAELVELGVTDIDVGTEPDYVALALGRYRERSYKTASFNVGGAQRARDACRALMAALPEIDWHALEQAENEQIAAAGSLHTNKWLGIIKWGLAAAAVVGIAVAVYRLATGHESAERAERRRSDPFAETAAQLGVIGDYARDARIADLTTIHDSTCDRRVVPELARLLRAANRGHVADALEHEPCNPVRPTCEPVKEILATRLSHELKIFRDHSWRMQCEGLLVPGPQGLFPGLALLVTGSGHDKVFHALRGITSTDGHRDVVAFAEQPRPGRFVGVADLDDDPGDELVFAGAELTISRISDAELIDIEGPALVGACNANAAVEGDFRHGRAGASRYVVLTVDDQAPAKGCPRTGRHYYGLVKGAVAEVE
jgi:hypothetical protein